MKQAIKALVRRLKGTEKPICKPLEFARLAYCTHERIYPKPDISACPVGSAILKLPLALDTQTPKAIRAVFHEINRHSPCGSRSGKTRLTEKSLVLLLIRQASFYASVAQLLSSVLQREPLSEENRLKNRPCDMLLPACLNCNWKNDDIQPRPGQDKAASGKRRAG